MLDNSSSSAYPFNWTACLESFPEFYRPLPSNAFLDEYGALGGVLGGSGTTSAMGSLRHCLSQPLQPSSLTASKVPETTVHLHGGSEQDDPMMSFDAVNLDRRWLQVNSAANRY